jgi:hypothetical protein
VRKQVKKMFSKIISRLYLGDEQDYRNLKKSGTLLAKPYLFVDARPFFNILSGDANKDELMIGPLNALAASLAMLIANGVTVYIYCQAGMERSPFLTALTLFQLGGEPRQTLEECYREVAQKRPETLVYPQWVEAMQCL